MACHNHEAMARRSPRPAPIPKDGSRTMKDLSRAPLKALVFDLDGTLVDAFEDIRQALNHSLERQGFAPLDLTRTTALVGHGLKRLVTDAIGQPVAEELRQRVLMDLMAYYQNHLTDHTRPYPGVSKVLEAARHRGLRLGVLSNKADALTNRILDDLGLARYFDAIWGMRLGLPAKPNPEGARMMLDELETTPDGAAMIGDGETDLNVGREAGMRTVACLYGARSREQLAPCDPDAWAESPAQLLEWLQGQR